MFQAAKAVVTGKGASMWEANGIYGIEVGVIVGGVSSKRLSKLNVGLMGLHTTFFRPIRTR